MRLETHLSGGLLGSHVLGSGFHPQHGQGHIQYMPTFKHTYKILEVLASFKHFAISLLESNACTFFLFSILLCGQAGFFLGS